MTTESLVEQLRRSVVNWEPTSESKYVFQAVFQNTPVKLRLNDFPDEPFCTVICNEQEVDVEPFPDTWTLPKHREKHGEQSKG